VTISLAIGVFHPILAVTEFGHSMARGHDFLLEPIVNRGLKIAPSILSFGQSAAAKRISGCRCHQEKT
jgi:hypothetical protein